MRRAAPWLLAVGAALLVLGVVLVVRGGDAGGGLEFLSPEQFDQLRGARRRAAAGRLLLVAGAALLGALAGRLLTGGARHATRVACLVGVAAAGLVVAGLLLLRAADGTRVTAHGGSYEPLGCPGWPACEQVGDPARGDGRWPGAASALAGGLVVGAVAGRWPAGDRRSDQQ